MVIRGAHITTCVVLIGSRTAGLCQARVLQLLLPCGLQAARLGEAEAAAEREARELRGRLSAARAALARARYEGGRYEGGRVRCWVLGL